MNAKRRTAWDAALSIVESLRSAGYTALLAGGCVRDRLIGETPKDYDVATDAPPERVRAVFPRSRKVGAKFGVMLVRRFKHDIEVATFRADGSYSDGRHPDRVTYGTQEEDARRRDFTINGLFYDPASDRVIDYVGGRRDIERRIIRTIGDPGRRFSEDHLRMLRAVRFAARLGFSIEPATAWAIAERSERLRDISAERIWMELSMILAAPSRAVGWSLIVETGLRAHLASGWTVRPEEDAFGAGRLAALPPARVRPALGLAAVLGHRPAEEVVRVCRSLKLSNEESDAVAWLLRSVARVLDPQRLELADVKHLMAARRWDDLPVLLRAHLVADGAGLEPYEAFRRRAAAIRPERVAPAPLITGHDLGALGVSPGPEMGRVLAAVYRAQLNEELDSKGEALRLARTLIGG